jgi:hypothetical protein
LPMTITGDLGLPAVCGTTCSQRHGSTWGSERRRLFGKSRRVGRSDLSGAEQYDHRATVSSLPRAAVDVITVPPSATRFDGWRTGISGGCQRRHSEAPHASPTIGKGRGCTVQPPFRCECPDRLMNRQVCLAQCSQFILQGIPRRVAWQTPHPSSTVQNAREWSGNR